MFGHRHANLVLRLRSPLSTACLKRGYTLWSCAWRYVRFSSGVVEALQLRFRYTHPEGRKIDSDPIRALCSLACILRLQPFKKKWPATVKGNGLCLRQLGRELREDRLLAITSAGTLLRLSECQGRRPADCHRTVGVLSQLHLVCFWGFKPTGQA